mgnify:CR=1 FL=1
MAKITKNYLTVVPNDFIRMFVHLHSKNVNVPTFMLWGMPGVGKSQAVKQAANELGDIIGKKVNVTVASLLLMNPIDLRGIPTKDTNEAGDLVARWLTPEIFKMDASDKVINILFLDEISAAPPSVQAAAYQIALDKRVGEHKLPANCIVIAAGNRVTDKAVAYKMPKPLGNRMTHFEMVASVDDWKIWAYSQDIHPTIIGFINHKNEYLCQFDPSTDDVAYATPRSWEMVDSYMKLITDKNKIDDYLPCIAGTVGLGVAQEFLTYTKVYDKIPHWSNIESGQMKTIPENICRNNPDLMFAFASMVSTNVVKWGKKVNYRTGENLDKFNEILGNVCRLITNMTEKEIMTLIVRDMYRGSDRNSKKALIQHKDFAPMKKIIQDAIL